MELEAQGRGRCALTLVVVAAALVAGAGAQGVDLITVSPSSFSECPPSLMHTHMMHQQQGADRASPRARSRAQLQGAGRRPRQHPGRHNARLQGIGRLYGPAALQGWQLGRQLVGRP